ncbi:hypothetical protein [Hymenobacter cavernae]|uniref:Uncharacterized protein n=1 Tax=Hymenobacter cavernae TaxID=2044852 RepID=A0ABQ1TLE1_9BACT|nr:hypothetical protein [Hymenobacter cavernae]GGE97979.1 hypothetical protein GCM10011383_05940 [Hymenobacter cavernae]
MQARVGALRDLSNSGQAQVPALDRAGAWLNLATLALEAEPPYWLLKLGEDDLLDT